jgi:hypothetical protein
MSILDKKNKIFGNIAAARTLTDNLPKLKLSSSFPSINTGGNSITFLTDLVKSLIGYEALVNTVVETLTHSLSDIETSVKTALKFELKGIVSCGVDPSIPAFLKSTGSGVNVEVNKIDFLDLLKIDPTSQGGLLLYGGASDFNTFLYNTIQNDGTPQIWPSTGTGILSITFNSIGVGIIPNNTITIKTTPTYDNKTLTDLNNDFINSLNLFDAKEVINRIMDGIFGSIGISVGKTKKQLETEAKIDNIVDCIVNSDDDDVIDDNYFTFSNEEIYVHQQQADNKQKGIIKLECCNKVSASVPTEFLTNFSNEFTGTTSVQEQKIVISSNLNKMADFNSENSENPVDNYAIKLNFFQKIIDMLVKAIVGIILTPKILIIFMINYKIVYGISSIYSDPVDFIKKNKNLIKSIVKKITGMIIEKLLALALKEIAELVARAEVKKQIEKGKNKLSQILSLVGVSQDTLRIITGLTKQ